jgi:hypothetical protein
MTQTVLLGLRYRMLPSINLRFNSLKSAAHALTPIVLRTFFLSSFSHGLQKVILFIQKVIISPYVRAFTSGIILNLDNPVVPQLPKVKKGSRPARHLAQVFECILVVQRIQLQLSALAFRVKGFKRRVVFLDFIRARLIHKEQRLTSDRICHYILICLDLLHSDHQIHVAV